MSTVILRRTLRDRSRALVAWALCLAATGALIVFSFGQMSETLAQYEQLLKAYPEEILAFLGIDATQFASPAGFLRAELDSWIPAVVMVFAVLAGARMTAAEEESGTIDLLLAAPVTRASVVLQKVAALAVSMVVVVGGLWAGVQAAAWASSMAVPATSIAADALQLAAMGLAFGTVAVLIGAVTGRRGLSAGIAGGIAAASFLLFSLSGLIDAVEPWKQLSLYYYYAGSSPILHGLDVRHLAVLLSSAAALTIAATWAFNRRDLAT